MIQTVSDDRRNPFKVFGACFCSVLESRSPKEYIITFITRNYDMSQATEIPHHDTTSCNSQLLAPLYLIDSFAACLGGGKRERDSSTNFD